MQKYYLHNGIDNIGPFSKEELKTRKITKDTPVWSNEMDDWKKAGEIDELKIILLTMPPPLIKAPYDNKTTPKKSNLIKYLILGISLVAILAIASNINSENTTTQDNFAAGDEAIKTQIRNNITSLIQVATNQYEVDSFGGISNLNVIVTNTTDYTIDQITVAVDYIKKNDGIYKTEYLTFYNIPAKQNKSLPAPNSNRGLSVNLTKQTITASELNLCYDNKNAPAVGNPDPYKCN